MKHIVGVADMKISDQPEDELVTHALGSCLGIAAYDPVAVVAGLLHVMLPLSTINPEKAKQNPCMFVDTGVPHFFRQLYKAGAIKKRIVVKVAGGANVQNNGNDRFAIGKRNYIVLKKLFWRNGVLIEAEDVGGSVARTMHLQVATGKVLIASNGQTREL
ncbi:MAG: chemotaxis protein CheD [Candidatus Neomarinimicrobiota bacterium]|nr:MAG: chemotaxis protein CheD [Candidatus Neomarinimicrobiota bacterium]